MDVFRARAFDQRSEPGGYLDAIADELLLVSVFAVLAMLGEQPLRAVG